MLSSVTLLELGQSISMNQTLQYYESMPGNNSRPEFTASGAYLFRPRMQTRREFSVTDFSFATVSFSQFV